MCCRRIFWAIFVAVALFPGAVMGHEVGGSQFESPIPLPFLLAGAGVTVAVTALWLGWSGQPPGDSGTQSLGVLPRSVTKPARVVTLVMFTTALIVAVAAGYFGPQAAAENLATAVVWGVWIKGIGLLSMLVGSPWSLLSPWHNVHRTLSRLEDESLSLLAYPDRLGVWPAVVGFILVVGIAENLVGVPRSPLLTAGLVVAYALVMILAGVAFGPTWFSRGDAFAVLYRQLGRVAPVHVVQIDNGGYRLRLRSPWLACMHPLKHPGSVTFVVTMVYTVSFDGFTSTPEYQTLLFQVRDLLGAGTLTPVLLYVTGLVVFVVSFRSVVFVADVAGGATGEEEVDSARAFASTVIPIAAAYEFAHYYPYVSRNVGRAFELALAAVGTNATIDPLGWLSLPLFWGSQVLLIIGGHIVAVVAAHGVAVERYPTMPAARRGHLPLVVLMVGYTILSLWIVSRPVVTG